jgi:hypothetical protein
MFRVHQYLYLNKYYETNFHNFHTGSFFHQQSYHMVHNNNSNHMYSWDKTFNYYLKLSMIMDNRLFLSSKV